MAEPIVYFECSHIRPVARRVEGGPWYHIHHGGALGSLCEASTYRQEIDRPDLPQTVSNYVRSDRLDPDDFCDRLRRAMHHIPGMLVDSPTITPAIRDAETVGWECECGSFEWTRQIDTEHVGILSIHAEEHALRCSTRERR